MVRDIYSLISSNYYVKFHLLELLSCRDQRYRTSMNEWRVRQAPRLSWLYF